ncbi:hypothetical protein JL108_18635 [Aeromicrobium sp. YIM 150415]|uniref:hypothetical protein n=1 Tax=Aeromicrobium sp. YIM 150415 TaxID=2803912 RepID=UPI001966358D|nr:hypothetical protein [Aeromicrobium sp. YIM 150415]MBM9465471.1 hypothetical protein [Aeromicrobium sp. YIM 150415]
MNRRYGSLLVIPLVVLSLVSCSGDDGDGGTKDEIVDSYTDITDQQGSVQGFVGAVDDAEVERCEASGDGWVAEGNVTNPEDVEQSYRLYVAYNEDRDTQGLVQVDVAAVPPGGTETWSAQVPLTADELECVLRVERFAPLS